MMVPGLETQASDTPLPFRVFDRLAGGRCYVQGETLKARACLTGRFLAPGCCGCPATLALEGRTSEQPNE